MALMVGPNGVTVGIEHIPQLQELAKRNIENDHPELLNNGQLLLIGKKKRLGSIPWFTHHVIKIT